MGSTMGTRFIRSTMALLLAAAVLGFGSAAWAGQGGEGNNTGCNGVGNANSPCGGQGGAGGSVGNITNTNTNSNSNSNHNTNTNVNTNVNNLSNKQHQSQGQVQGQAQNNKQTIAPSQTVNEGSTNIDEPRQAPPAFAPGLVAAPETCMGAVAVGASSPFGGISFGTTYKSEDCELRMYARSLMSLASTDARYAQAAAALLSQNPNVMKAMLSVGLQMPGAPKAAAATLTAPVANAAQLEAVAVVVSTPSRDETQVLCGTQERKIRAGNGEYFCRAQ